MKARAAHRTMLREHIGVAPEALAGLGLAAKDVLDLCTGCNPYGPPETLLDAVREAAHQQYPDPTGAPARTRVAEHLHAAPESVVLGNGAADLLWTCARVLAAADGSKVLAIEPGYREFAVACRQLGARVVQWRSVERRGHAVDLQQVEELMRLEAPNVVSLCAPGSPTGSSVRFDALEALAMRFPDSHFVVDQTLLALSDDHADLSRLPSSNVICVRSLSKDFGIPGVRAAYLLADPKLAARIEATRPAFSTSSAAQAAIMAATQLDDFLAESRLQLQADRARLALTLDTLGLVYTPSAASFLLVRMARASEVAAELLARNHIAVCDCTQYGLPDHVRIAGVTAGAAPLLAAALRDCIARRGLTHGREP